MASDIDLTPVLAGSPDGVLVLGTDGTIRFVNPAAAYLLGRRAAELLRRRLDLTVVPDEAFALTLARPDGDEVVLDVRVVAAPWLGESACVLWLRDITRQVALQVHRRRPGINRAGVLDRINRRLRRRPAHRVGQLRRRPD